MHHRFVALGLLASVLSLSGGALGGDDKIRPSKPAKHVPATFLGKDPHGPLARVVDGKVAKPEDGACTAWGVRGDVWNAVDAFGQIVGAAKVTELERYDVSGCDELTLTKTKGERGVGLFVRGSYEPLAIRKVTLAESVKKDLAAIIAKRDARVPETNHGAEKKPELALDQRMIAYEVQGGATTVLVGGRAISVLRLEQGKWTLEHEKMPQADLVWEEPDMFLPIGVLDMDADGRPEIVVHERYIDGYSDFTLTQNGEQKWSEVSAGIWGAHA